MKNLANTPAPAVVNDAFSESQWLRMLFVIADTEQWLRQLQVQHFYALPLSNHKKLLRKRWYLSAGVTAHILERHYYKINRHPGTGKFTIPIPQLLHYIKEAGSLEPQRVPQTGNMQRVWQAEEPIGYDINGTTTSRLTVISDPAGNIITAFPGELLAPEYLKQQE